MRDNLPPRFVGPPPQSKERLQRHKDPEVKRKEKKKIDKARRERGYNVTEVVGMTCLFMHFFLIPKGDDNIWMARPAMGLCPSPYQAVQGALQAKRVALGNRVFAG